MKGGARIHKAVAVVAVTMIIGGLGMVTAGAAWSAGLHDSEPHLRFDNDLRRAVLVIPNPPCPTRSLHCHWQLYVNRVDVPGPHQWAIGTRGVVSLPIEHCGDYQADALISTGSYYNWTYVTGIRYHIDYCPPNTTTTTTTHHDRPSSAAPEQLDDLVDGRTQGRRLIHHHTDLATAVHRIHHPRLCGRDDDASGYGDE